MQTIVRPRSLIPSALALALLYWSAPLPCPAESTGYLLPHLERRGAATTLVVEGQPYLVLGGELHNSSASSLEYMAPLWPRLKALNLNTVLATVSWELVEPQEGKFDFTLVDGLIEGARKHELRLVLLWFGSWKNGVSTYPPGWVKTNLTRFPRVQTREGRNTEVLTPLSEANGTADLKAYAALLRHVREVDKRRHTVLMVQVENEAGTLGQPRDYSPLAEAEFAKPAPSELTAYFVKFKDTLIPEFKTYWEAAGARTNGNWSEVFGAGADEAFMAWHLARYIGRMAAAGKVEYPLPMYANAWLVQNENQKAGQYPSGGPVSKVLDIWRAAAPAIDFLAPDIYLPDFKGVCASYTRSGNPLFIPEAGRGPDAAAKAFYAIGQHGAIGFCPFGIDDLPPESPLKEAYALLAELTPLLTQHLGRDQLLGLYQQNKEEGERVDFAGCHLEVSYKGFGKSEIPGYGLVIATGPDEFVVAGAGLGIHFSARTPGGRTTRILAIDEGRFKNGQWIPGRRLNGDENAGGWRLQLPGGKPSIQKIKLYRHD